MGDPIGLLDLSGAAWTLAALGCAARAAAVLACAGVLAVGLRRQAAATRHLVWVFGLAGALAVLPLALAVPRWALPVLPVAMNPEPRPEPASVERIVPAPEKHADPLPINVAAVPRPGGAAAREKVVLETAARTALGTSQMIGRKALPWPLALWGAGTAAVLAWYAAGKVAIGRLGRRAGRIDDPRWGEILNTAAGQLGINARVTLLRGGPAAMPVTWGVLRPMVLLPAEADGWPLERRRAVLLHELAHVRRRDGLTQGLAQAACAAYWFNPLAWWAAARLRAEREQACDDLVLEAGELPSAYAAELLGVARSLRPALTAMAMPMARPSGLERRLRAILDPTRSRRGPARWLAAAGLMIVLGASATLAAVQLVARDEARPVVSGRVVGADGKPVEGASLAVLALSTERRGPVKIPAPAVVLGEAASDAQGQFHVNVRSYEIAPDMNLCLVATAPGLTLASRTIADLAGPVEEPIRLVPEQPVEVRLVDLEGVPLAGAAVRLWGGYPMAGGEGVGPVVLTSPALSALARVWKTDADGRFTPRGIAPGSSLTLRVSAPGFGTQFPRFETKADTRTNTLALGRAHVIEGRVILGKGGPPAVGAHIQAESMSSKDGIGLYLGEAEATTDADGRYRLEAAPGGSMRVQVDPPPKGADAYLLRGELVVPGEAMATHLDVVLPKGVLVRGRVLEAGTGRPVAGAVVTHQAHERNNPYFIKSSSDWFNGGEQEAVTAANGTFRLGIMPGPGYLLVRGPSGNYLRESISSVDLHGELIWPNVRHYPDALKKLNPRPDEDPVDVELTLRPGVTVRGHLVDPRGEPVRDAVLFSRWYPSRRNMTINHGQPTLPVRGGRFALGGCDPQSSAPVFFLDAKRQMGAVVEFSGKQASGDVEVKLAPCGSATARLVDGEGKPLRPGRRAANLEVVLTPGPSWGDPRLNDDRASPLLADTIIVANLDRERYRTVRTDKDGRVTFPTLIPGATYRVYVHNQPVKTQIEFTVQPGEAKDLGELVIRNADQAG